MGEGPRRDAPVLSRLDSVPDLCNSEDMQFTSTEGSTMKDILKREVRASERSIELRITALRNQLLQIEKEVKAGLRVSSSIGGDPFVVDLALQLDADIRRRQTIYDLGAYLLEEAIS